MSSKYNEKTNRKSRPNAFIGNLLRKGTITEEMAALLATLATPHQQLEALMRRKQEPQRALASIVEEIKSAAAESERADVWVSQARAPRKQVQWRLVGKMILTFGTLLLAAVVWRTIMQLRQATDPQVRVPEPAPVSPAPLAAKRTEPPAPAAGAPAAPAAIPAAPRVQPEDTFQLKATPLPTGMYHVTWKGTPGASYRLFTGKQPDAINEDETGPIPMNWIDWMPPQDVREIWMAVAQVGSDGAPSARSAALHLVLSETPLKN